ncbi:hypothetical protein ACTXPD_18605 [Vreelandella alkaliphila]|uniref:Uncharacterized protein n=1 Tax=Halomonas campaniensis TaxID=213554 RepID=A0A3D0KHJ6_9GAMM|nr:MULTISPECIES: hypothetical protein [Halomonas]HCA02649.1 hypothetical protein [Halomonas campaniensis]
MPVIPDTIAENAFMDEYKPVELEREADVMMQTFDEALALAEKRGGGVSNVWSIAEGDEGDSLYALAGFHHVNVIGFIVTEKAWETGIEEVLWFDSEDMCD